MVVRNLVFPTPKHLNPLIRSAVRRAIYCFSRQHETYIYSYIHIVVIVIVFTTYNFGPQFRFNIYSVEQFCVNPREIPLIFFFMSVCVLLFSCLTQISIDSIIWLSIFCFGHIKLCVHSVLSETFMFNKFCSITCLKPGWIGGNQ